MSLIILFFMISLFMLDIPSVYSTSFSETRYITQTYDEDRWYKTRFSRQSRQQNPYYYGYQTNSYPYWYDDSDHYRYRSPYYGKYRSGSYFYWSPEGLRIHWGSDYHDHDHYKKYHGY